MKTILEVCEIRKDEWAVGVKGRIEYFCKDLHAADSLYHQSCDVNFRTNKGIPIIHMVDPHHKRRKVGRPKGSIQEEAFLKMCQYLEENDEEQLTVTDRANNMRNHSQESDPYCNRYLKSKLLEHYGDRLVVTDTTGLHDVVISQEKTSLILRDYL